MVPPSFDGATIKSLQLLSTSETLLDLAWAVGRFWGGIPPCGVGTWSKGVGCGVWCLELGGQYLASGVMGSGFRVWVLEFDFGVWGLLFGVWDFECCL